MAEESFTFEEATAPFSFEEAKAEPFSFEEAQGATVAQMASATRHTVGVVGRAIAANDLALSNKPIGDSDSYETQLADAGITAEEAEAAKKESEGVWMSLRGEAEKWYPNQEAATAAISQQLATARANYEQFTRGPELPRIDFDKLPTGVKMVMGMPGTKGGISEGAKIAAGTYNALKTLPEFFMTPLGASLLATGNLPEITRRLIAGGFAVDMAIHTPEQIMGLAKAIQGGKTEEIAEASTALGMNVGFVALATKHALPKTPLEQVAPVTAEAASKVIDTKPSEAPLPPAQSVEVSKTPLTTAAVESVKAKEPALDTPAPTPAVATSESGPPPVPAGVPPAKPSVTPEVTSEQIKEIVRPQKELEQDLRKEGWNVSPVKIAGSKNLVDYWDVSYRAKKVSEADTAEAGWQKIADGKISAPTEPTAHEKAISAELDARQPAKPEGERTLTKVRTQTIGDVAVGDQVIVRSQGRPFSGRVTAIDLKGDQHVFKVVDSTGYESLQNEYSINPRAKWISDHPEFESRFPPVESVAPAVPQHLLPAKSTQAILDSQPATPPPEGGIKPKMAEAPEGGAVFGIGGRRPAPPRPVGDTPRGDRNWLRIPSALRRVGRGLFTEGARAVLGRTRNQVGQELSRATRRHVDVEQELFGMHEAVLRTAVRAIPRQRLDAAMTEASQYFREVENGRPAPALSPEAQSLVDAWFAIGRSTGDIARANNVMVFDPALGAHRPMGNVKNYVPRMFTAEVEAVLRDPQADPALFNRLAQEIATQRGIALDVAANELRGVAGRFQANDYMANLELARGAQMPEVFYEYNLRNLAARYLPSYSERMAQIIAYGQRLGPREAPQRQNLWDVARRESEDAYTQEWLNNREDQATGFKTKSDIERNARRAQALASATLLSDPATTVPRNFLSGIAATTETYGVGRSVRQLREAARIASRLGARELGAIRDDLASFLNSDQLGDSALDNAVRGFSTGALKASGFTGSENFVRTHNALVASTFVRDAAASLAANPASKLSREALAQFQRWNINPEAIITEGGNWRTGPETRRYMRTAVREMQGGYRFDQVPGWANTTAGRFFYQYGRWGVQRSQHIFQNIIRPAIGEDVQFRGQRMVHRDTLPLIRAAAFMIGLGETFSAISFGWFGKDRRDSSLSEISAAWSEDELKAVGLLGERMVNDIIMAGTLGIIGQPLDIMKAAKDQSRFKNPLDPPSAAGVKAFVSLAQRAVDQDGTLTKKDWLDAASSVARGPKNVSDIARHQLGESLYEGQNDQRTLRNAALRWAKETKEDVPIRGGGKDFRKSPTAPTYEAINDALLSGNAEAAKKAAESHIANQTEANKDKAREAIRSSVQARKPFRAGNLTSDVHKNDFMKWAEKNLSAADLEQIKRVQERYEKTASDAGLN